MTTYHARVERGDRFSLIYVPEVDMWTQARNLRQVGTMARDLVATMRDVEPDSLELEVGMS